MFKRYIPDIAFVLGLAFLCLAMMLPASLTLPDITNQGGDLTSELPGRSAIQVNAPNVTDENRRQQQLMGFGVFHSDFVAANGLGPFFNNPSCRGCHVENGRGPTRLSRVNELGSTMVLKVGLRGLQANRAAKPVPGLGEQILDHAVKGKPISEASVKWLTVLGKYPDGTKYTLRKPQVSFKVPGYNSRQLVSSLRMTPPVIGPGLLENVPDSVILAKHDPKDNDKDGISGRYNLVIDAVTGKKSIGKFGFKASHPSLAQQTAAALINDMGVGNKIFADSKNESNPVELSDENFDLLVVYQKLAGVPKARNQDNPNVIAGKALFKQIGCDKCHSMTLTTGESADPELANQTFHPFTDLLLHDMGRELADNRPEFSAKGSEWKTTPLWGLGMTRELAGKRAFFMHDGRARSIEEAILWHGGEAEQIKLKFKNLTKKQRSQLLAFLDSL